MTMAAKPTFRQLYRCLTGALMGTLAPADLPANEAEWEKVLRLSSAHLATPLLRWALRKQGLFPSLPPDVAEYLDAIYTLNLDRNLEYLDQLAHLIQTLNSIGVRPLLLKGAATFVGGLYPSPGDRITGDIDILIPSARLPEIVGKLAAVGYQASHPEKELPNPEDFGTQDHHYPMLISPDWPIGVELHVQPVHLQFVKLLCSEDVFGDAKRILWRGGDCLLPSPTHFIVHHMIHTFLRDTKLNLMELSLRRLFEFVHASQTYGEQIDWREVRNRFDHQGYRNELREYVLFAHTCFDFFVPAEIDIGTWDRMRIQPLMIRRDLAHPAIEWPLNIVRQLRYRVRSVRQDPRNLKKIFTADFYSRLWQRLVGGVKANTFQR